MASFLSSVFGRGGQAAEVMSRVSDWRSPDRTTLDDERKHWTTNGGPPIIVWHANSHGARNRPENRHKQHEKKKTEMMVDGFAIAGNEKQCGLMGVVKVAGYDRHPEFNGKGIDYCIPELLTSIFSDCEEKNLDPNDCFDKAIHEVKILYQKAGLYQALFEKGGFRPMTDPTLYHYYQFFANPGENERPSGLPMRSAAGDARYSQSEIYGLWIIYTNITALEHLSLTFIRSLLGFRDHVFLPPEVMNSINMAGRKNKTPIGALVWMNAIRDLAKYDSLTPGGEINKSRLRALTALNNLWKTRRTNLHDILDIFTPFNQIGMKMGIKPIRVRTIDVTCRSDIGKLYIPDPSVELPFATKILDSVSSFTGDRWVSEPRMRAKTAEFAQSEDDEATQAYLNAIEVQKGDEFADDLGYYVDGDGGDGGEFDGEGWEEEDPSSPAHEGESDGDDGGGDGDMAENTHPSPPAVGHTGWVNKRNKIRVKKHHRPSKTLRPRQPGVSLKKDRGRVLARQGLGKVVSLKLKHKSRGLPPSISPKTGGAKRKYSRKRNTRTRNRYTRTRNRYTRRRTPR